MALRLTRLPVFFCVKILTATSAISASLWLYAPRLSDKDRAAATTCVAIRGMAASVIRLVGPDTDSPATASPAASRTGAATQRMPVVFSSSSKD